MDDALVIVSKVYRIYANVPGHAYELGEDEGSIVAALPPELGRSAAMVLDAVRTRFGAAWAYYSTGFTACFIVEVFMLCYSDCMTHIHTLFCR